MNLPRRNDWQCKIDGLQARVDVVGDTERVVELNSVDKFQGEWRVTSGGGPGNGSLTSACKAGGRVERQRIDERKEDGERAAQHKTRGILSNEHGDSSA